jgi:hypothetical protein
MWLCGGKYLISIFDYSVRMSASKEDTNQVARQLLHWEIGDIEWLVAEGIQLGADDGVMSHTAGKLAKSSHTYRCT